MTPQQAEIKMFHINLMQRELLEMPLGTWAEYYQAKALKERIDKEFNEVKSWLKAQGLLRDF